MLPHRWGNRGPQKKQVYKWTYMEDPLFSILWFCDTCANLLDTILVCASENGYKRVQVPAFIWSCSYGHVGILECPVPQGPVMPWPHCTTPSGVQETTCAHAAPMRRGSATKWHPARCGSPRWPKHRLHTLCECLTSGSQEGRRSQSQSPGGSVGSQNAEQVLTHQTIGIEQTNMMLS